MNQRNQGLTVGELTWVIAILLCLGIAWNAFSNRENKYYNESTSQFTTTVIA